MPLISILHHFIFTVNYNYYPLLKDVLSYNQINIHSRVTQSFQLLVNNFVKLLSGFHHSGYGKWRWCLDNAHRTIVWVVKIVLFNDPSNLFNALALVLAMKIQWFSSTSPFGVYYVEWINSNLSVMKAIPSTLCSHIMLKWSVANKFIERSWTCRHFGNSQQVQFNGQLCFSRKFRLTCERIRTHTHTHACKHMNTHRFRLLSVSPNKIG